MFSLFKRKPVLTGEDLLFQLETYKWLMKYFGGEDFFHNTQLVLPTDQFFPLRVGSSDEAVIATFAQVQVHAGMAKWPSKLIRQEHDADPHLGHTLLVKGSPSTANGTFSLREGKAYISFNPELENNPARMVATFAHEFGHYLTCELPESPPGGWENWEFATDLTAVFLGFGIFSANTAFSFQQYTNTGTQGWRSQRSGYLSSIELLFALAIFCRLKGISPDIAKPYIKPTLRKVFRQCCRQVDGCDELINEIRSVNYVGAKDYKPARFE